MSIVASVLAIDKISDSKDPRKDIFAAVGDLSKVIVKWNMVLVGTYIRPKKTAGGIIRPDSNIAEDEWQGKVGLVLKIGPQAYKDDDEIQFDGELVDVGEWAVYKIGDASLQLNINGYPCRLIRDSSIRMTVTDPSIIF